MTEFTNDSAGDHARRFTAALSERNDAASTYLAYREICRVSTETCDHTARMTAAKRLLEAEDQLARIRWGIDEFAPILTPAERELVGPQGADEGREYHSLPEDEDELHESRAT